MSSLPETTPAEARGLCLVVDDSPTVRKFVSRIVREMRLELGEAENGQLALENCLRRMPDTILLDWNMPVMSGIDFLRHLRKLEGGQKPTVIFCTTETDVAHLREAFDAGADQYIMKPFDAATLRSKLACATGADPIPRDDSGAAG